MNRSMRPRPHPPRFAESALRMFVPHDRFGESVLGDLQEEFTKVAASRSRFAANQWYRLQALRLVSMYTVRPLLRLMRRDKNARPHRAFQMKNVGEIVGHILHDLRYTVRMLRGRPAFTITVVLTLALGIGASSAIFSVVNGVLLRPLPYPEPNDLVSVWGRFLPESGFDFPQFSLAPPEYVDYKNATQTMEAVAGYYSYGTTVVDGDGDPERIPAARVTSNLFTLLRVPALLGRTLVAEDDLPTSDGVVVLGYSAWHRRFGGDEHIIGRSITLGGLSREVVGVMPPGFGFPNPNVQLWSALQLDEARRDNRQSHFLFAVARLAPGKTLEGAKVELGSMMAQWKADFPDIHTGHFLFVQPYVDDVVGNVRAALWLLLGAVGFVLLIVCANVANLLMAVGEQRRQEIAIREALGAGRSRILQQLLTESLTLSELGGGIGLLLAVFGTKAVLALDAGTIPRVGEIQLDARVLIFTGVLTLATSLVFGLIPALQTSSSKLQSTFREGGGATATGARLRLRRLLVVSEIALSVLLIISAGLMVKSFRNLLGEDPGFDSSNMLVAQLSLPPGNYDPDQASAFYTDLLREVAAIPGVVNASAISRLPIMHGRGVTDFQIEGRPPPELGEVALNAADVSARTGYFEIMRIPLLQGRFFDETDRAGTQPVAIINEAMVRKFWPGEDPLGKRIRYSGCDSCAWMNIVGIVGNVKYQGLSNDPPPVYYYSNEQATEHQRFYTRFMALTVKTAGDPLTVAPVLRAAIRNLDPKLPVVNLQSMASVVTDSVARPRFVVTLMGIFAGVALVLGAVGIYGVMSYSVAQRTNEIGVRIALGASGREVSRMVVGQGMRVAVLGIVAGVAGAFFVTRYLDSLLFNVSTTDPVTYAMVAMLLTGVALIASYLPARRATLVDPMTAIRTE